jgi:hypothetical protein
VCALFGAGFATGYAVHEDRPAEDTRAGPAAIEMTIMEQEMAKANAEEKAFLARSSSPRYIKPSHTVWHNGTESTSHVIIKLVNDRGVFGELNQLGNGGQQATLSIGGLNLSNAVPVFPTHRRRKLQATDEPTDQLHLFFELDTPDGNGAALCDILNNDTSVEIAYLAPMPAELPIASSSDDGHRRTLLAIRHALASKTDLRRMLSPSFVHLQGYRGPAPNGFDFDEAEKYSAGLGAGITVADIEFGANIDHEDLGMQGAEQVNSMYPDPDEFEHGTAVWGEIKGEHDAQGVRGGAVAVTPIVANIFDAAGAFIPIATVIADTADHLQAGDVMLIELQYGFSDPGIDADYTPVEFYPAEWAAIRAAVDKGVVVVEAGANGHMDLDAVQTGRFNRGSVNFADSGAIRVGGARHNQRTWIGSSFGSRIDVQGWYDWSVTTTGYGGLRGNVGDNDAYTSSFSGTSSASPLVTAAAAVMQSVAKQSLGRVLEPNELRDLMVKTGTPQPAEDAATHPIGPQPNLKWALGALSNERAMHGGCCQRSLTDNRVAPWEYLNGVPIALESKTIGCERNKWMPHKTYNPATEKCEDLRTFKVVSGDCTVRNQCVYSNFGVTQYANNQDCIIKQLSPFPLQARQFDVEYHYSCSWDSLLVNGQKYCGTAGPNGVTPTAGADGSAELIWRSDYIVTGGGFQICPPDADITMATLSGSTYAACQGTYAKSGDTFNGKPIWDRTDGQRFVFWCQSLWLITGSQWRDDFLAKGSSTSCGAFIWSKTATGIAADHWWAADWSRNGAGVTASP